MSADFGLTFGAPLAPFGLILVAFWLKLGPFWCHVGPDFGYFAPSGCSFWLVVGEIKLLRQYFAKKYTCIDLASNFLQIFRMQIIFPRPGGGTIAAGNRDSPPGRLAAHRRGVLRFGHSLRVTFPHAPFPRSRSGFCSILFFSRRIPSWIPPFPSLVGRFLVTFGALLVESGLSCFRYVFLECFWTFFDVFLTSFWCYFYMFFAS